MGILLWTQHSFFLALVRVCRFFVNFSEHYLLCHFKQTLYFLPIEHFLRKNIAHIHWYVYEIKTELCTDDGFGVSNAVWIEKRMLCKSILTGLYFISNANWLATSLSGMRDKEEKKSRKSSRERERKRGYWSMLNLCTFTSFTCSCNHHLNVDAREKRWIPFIQFAKELKRHRIAYTHILCMGAKKKCAKKEILTFQSLWSEPYIYIYIFNPYTQWQHKWTVIPLFCVCENGKYRNLDGCKIIWLCNWLLSNCFGLRYQRKCTGIFFFFNMPNGFRYPGHQLVSLLIISFDLGYFGKRYSLTL